MRHAMRMKNVGRRVVFLVVCLLAALGWVAGLSYCASPGLPVSAALAHAALARTGRVRSGHPGPRLMHYALAGYRAAGYRAAGYRAAGYRRAVSAAARRYDPSSEYNVVAAFDQTLQGPNATADGNGTAISVGGLTSVGVTITGTMGAASVAFEETQDGTNWFAVPLTPSTGAAATSTTTSSPAAFSGSIAGFGRFRARIVNSAGTSLTIVAKGTMYGGGAGGSGGGGGGGGGIADGGDATEGSIADAAVTGDAPGTVNAHLRGLDAIAADVWDSTNHLFNVGLATSLDYTLDSITVRQATAANLNMANPVLTDTWDSVNHFLNVNLATNLNASDIITVNQLPSAVALADATANPTTSHLGADAFVWNGSTWDRRKSPTADGVAATGLAGAVLMAYNGATYDRVLADGSKSLKVAQTGALPAGANVIGGVTLASGAVASGALASGSIASGALAAGSIASGAAVSGAFADGAINTLGAQADAAVGDASGTANSHLRQIAKTLASTPAVSPAAAATGGATPYFFASAGGANQDATAMDASPGTLYQITCTNTTASQRYVWLYNVASGATSASTVVYGIALPANTTGSGAAVSIPVGMAFSTGISFRITTGVPGSSTAAASANDVLISAAYK